MPVVAEIQDIRIPPFILEREVLFGLNTPTAVQQVLDWKINEHLIALELRKQGRHQQADFIDAQQAFQHEARIEHHFEQNVNAHVEVSDEEIRTEIQKRFVTFAFRFIPLNSQEEALSIRTQWEQQGYDKALQSLVQQHEITALSERWQSPLMEAYDIDAGLLEILQELEIQQPSQPVFYNGQWLLFEVTDIRRQPIGEWDYEDQWESAKKVVWNRKALQRAQEYVSTAMQPLQVRTDKKALNALNKLLYPLFKNQSSTRSVAYLIDTSPENLTFSRSDYEAIAPLLLARWNGGTLSIADFIDRFIPGLYPIRANSQEQFLAALADAVALVVRDEVFFAKEETKAWQRSDSLQQEIRLREDKWLFQHYKNEKLAHAQTDTVSLVAYYEEQAERLGQSLIPFDQLPAEARTRLLRKKVQRDLWSLADSLKAIYAPSINQDQLQQLTQKLKPALETKHFKQVHIFKNYANRPAWPSVDPIWTLRQPSEVLQ